jgi:pimeloyl-ACP methyl ester carboxylesterase
VILPIVISAAVLLLLAVAVFLLAKFVPIICGLFMNITVRRTGAEDRPLSGQTVRFQTSDGITLVGTMSSAENSRPDAPVVVFCHEFTANRHSATTYAQFLLDAGYRVFSFDFRSHGDSDHPPDYQPRQWVTEYEVCDLRAALRYVKARPDCRDTRIGLFGLSRGAATAIIAASGDDRVSAIVSDSAFSSREILMKYMKRWRTIFVPPSLIWISNLPGVLPVYHYLSMKLAEHRLGVKFVRLARPLAKLRQPLFMLHGEKDNYVSEDHARHLHSLAPEGTTLWIVPGADHNRAASVAAAEYAKRIGSFFGETLGVPRETAAPVS